MSRVTVTELLSEAVATAANANATLTSWNTASADVDAANVREMGLDRRAMGTRCFTPADGRPTPLNQSGPSAALGVAALVQVAFGATLIEIGPINNNAGLTDQLRVSCSFQYLIETLGAGQQGLFVLGYGTASGGPWTEIPVTRRRSLVSAGLLNEVATIPDRGSCTITHKFSATNSANLWIALLYTLPGGTVTFDNLHMGAMLYAR